MLEIADLSVNYGRETRALRNVSLDVHDGEIVAVLGANGAGKSTLLRAISGTLGEHSGRVIAGSIRLQGRDLVRSAPHRIVAQGVCHIPEGRLVFGPLTVTENLVAAMTKRGREHFKQRAAVVYDLFPQLADRHGQLAGLLSGGEQQMLAIGRALMSSPSIIMIDEFSLGLAPLTVGYLRDAIVQINQDLGTSILMVEQNARLALRTAHRAYVMQTGEVRLSGTAGELSDEPLLRASYLGSHG